MIHQRPIKTRLLAMVHENTGAIEGFVFRCLATDKLLWLGPPVHEVAKEDLEVMEAVLVDVTEVPYGSA